MSENHLMKVFTTTICWPYQGSAGITHLQSECIFNQNNIYKIWRTFIWNGLEEWSKSPINQSKWRYCMHDSMINVFLFNLQTARVCRCLIPRGGLNPFAFSGISSMLRLLYHFQLSNMSTGASWAFLMLCIRVSVSLTWTTWASNASTSVTPFWALTTVSVTLSVVSWNSVSDSVRPPERS